MRQQIGSFYDRFSVLYPLIDSFLLPQKRILANTINELPNGRLLEIGVGNGSHLKFYDRHQITGIDISSAMLNKARKINPPTIKFHEMDGENLSFGASTFDYVVMSHVIAVAENPERLLNEAYRVLRPNGKLILLNHFTPDNWMEYMDRAAQLVSRLFHFRSVFRLADVPKTNFSLQQVRTIGRFGYYKLLTYQKN